MEYSIIPLRECDLDSIDFAKTNPAIYEIEWDGIRFNFLVNYKLGNKNAAVFGTGDYDRKIHKNDIVFDRQSWAKDINATCIYRRSASD